MDNSQINIYGPMYQDIEKEISKLAYYILFDDAQLKTYSPKIVELILRAATNIEAISIEIYRNETKNTRNISYGKAVDKINNIFKLKETPILIYSNSIYLSAYNRVLHPFMGWKEGESRSENGSIEKLGGWNFAYQTLKHNKTNDIYDAMKKYGNLSYLFKIASALFLLNFIYGKSLELPIVSDLFKIVQKDDNGKFGFWRKTSPANYIELDDNMANIIREYNKKHGIIE